MCCKLSLGFLLARPFLDVDIYLYVKLIQPIPTIGRAVQARLECINRKCHNAFEIIMLTACTYRRIKVHVPGW